ncbi:16S rRNA (cytosine1402-N4)-methyltransferase [Kineosphaera limosa]|uniref:Ribosomal RNA small subunit methyltransferase H n=1 Tax=Kineosphaera limosa NBRC 100340 TaxID=1184609 RepID=K6WW63_9MICO|nr:16S rRNA (cytosine(1402)-N(4))-methyltransferase RsmH [Kineosphaera limosa]NYD99269.1 16S rRNA (cytosine1402-N4)-methyltransferase [Kineosphaera limosa]GAB96307.1 ribosomal RNA small subunit methyltransferase H [Kineosphaera limosa NBRC 100340]
MHERETADRHVPVMLERIVEVLSPALAPGGPQPEGAPTDSTDESSGHTPVYVDGTLGMGGHTEAILSACPQAIAVGIDRDPQALRFASARLARFGDRFRPVQAVYDEIGDVLADLGLPGADAVLLDLGVSSLQLDEADRGFAYAQDAPLDMRMDPELPLTAADVLNTYEAPELARVLHEYGEERFARKIAGAVVRDRAQEPFTTSARLVELLRRAIPAASQRSGGHPAKRTFQALRIEVNGELAALASALPATLDSLRLGGRVAVLSYHSLEDRMVKRALAAASRGSAPPGLPVELAEHAPYLRLLGRGGEVPTAAEVEVNPRAASARLRVAMRIRAGAPGELAAQLASADPPSDRKKTPRRPTTRTPRTARKGPPR